MRIKMLSSRSGPSDNYVGGQEYDVADDRARKFIDRGFAVPVDAAEVVEAAVARPAPETATKYRRKK